MAGMCGHDWKAGLPFSKAWLDGQNTGKYGYDWMGELSVSEAWMDGWNTGKRGMAGVVVCLSGTT